MPASKNASQKGKPLPLLARVLLLAFGGLSLFLWIEILGGFSFMKGIAFLGGLVSALLIAALPNDKTWSKLTKVFVLGLGIVWIISQMLPIESTAAWLVSVFLAGVFGVVGYIIFFENFFD